MSSVAPPTILDAIGGAWFHWRCAACKEPVAYAWEPLPGDPDTDGLDATVFGRLCARCVLQAAEAVGGPPEDALQRVKRQRRLRACYRHIESVWRGWNLWDEWRADGYYTLPEFAARQQRVRHLFHLGDRPWPTLVMKQWYPPGQQRSASDPYLEMFQIFGVVPVASRAEVCYGDFAELPRYLIREHQRNGRREVYAGVLLAVHACYPPARPVEICWRWNPLTPDIDPVPDIDRFGLCSLNDFAALARHAQRLYYRPGRPGRPREVTKRWPPGSEDEFTDNVDTELSQCELDGDRLTKLEMLADRLAMSRAAFFRMWGRERTPDAYERWLEHQRRPPRR